MFNERMFYQTVSKYYENEDLEGAKKYLADQEKEAKYMMMPSFSDMS